MRNMERRKFEESWKDAFHQAEVNPGEYVWTDIELDLEKAKGVSLSKRLIFYKMLAAASVIFAVGIGVGLYISNETAASRLGAQQLSIQQKTDSSPAVPHRDSAINSQNTEPIPGDDKNATNDQQEKSSDGKSGVPVLKSESSDLIADQSVYTGVTQPEENEHGKMLYAFSNRKLPPLVAQKSIGRIMIKKEPEADPVALMLARLDQREHDVKGEAENKNNNKNEKLWTSVGFAAGSFSTVSSGVSSSPSSMSFASIANDEVKASGTSYSMGVNMGTQLSDRWVFQGGINYLTQSSDFTARNAVGVSNFTSFRPASLNELKMADAAPSENKVVTTAPYNVNNNIRYLSIPLQAGYLLVNRNFGLQLNAGVSTDLFLQNTVTAEGENMDKTSQKLGEDSPYRSVNLSGLMGTELSYRFSDRYRVALNPGIRYPFNSIYRSDLDVKASPLSFDLALRFRYIFH